MVKQGKNSKIETSLLKINSQHYNYAFSIMYYVL